MNSGAEDLPELESGRELQVDASILDGFEDQGYELREEGSALVLYEEIGETSVDIARCYGEKEAQHLLGKISDFKEV